MRIVLWIAAAASLLTSTLATAGVPDPARSSIATSGQALGCQYRFRADGSLDCLTVCVTIRDAFDSPEPSCSTTVTLTPTSNTLAVCNCCPNTQGIRTDLAGTADYVFCRLGGRGSLDVCVTTYCEGVIGMGCVSVDFTSSDLVGDCLPPTIVSLGLWADCLPPSPYCTASDFNCDGEITVLDLALWAGGLNVACDLVLVPDRLR